MLAAGSSETKSEDEKLSDKYGYSLDEVKQCKTIYGNDTEKVLSYLDAHGGGFLGFFRETCQSLFKKKPEYGETAYMIKALENGWKPESKEFLAFVKSEEEKIETERLRKQREAERKRQAQIALQNSCDKKWEKCKDNADLVNNYDGYSNIRSKCRSAIDELAKYGDPDWGGWLSLPFGTFYTGDSYLTSGIVHVVDEQVKMQNGFGAMVRTEAHCKFDLKQGKVIDAYVRN
jgi:hypothetical protein